MFDYDCVIHTYSREEAVDDGTLIDISTLAREAGIRFPCAITSAAWAECVAWTNDDNQRKGTVQDEAGRLWDVLSVFRYAAKHNDGSSLLFKVDIVPRDGLNTKPITHSLRAICGPGDQLEPVITIMLPHES